MLPTPRMRATSAREWLDADVGPFRLAVSMGMPRTGLGDHTLEAALEVEACDRISALTAAEDGP